MNDKIDESLNIMPMDKDPKESTEVSTEVKHTSDKAREIENDYKMARDNIYALMQNGANAMEELKEVASQTQQARAYEVLSTMMKTMLDANKDLIEISEKKNKEAVEEEKEQKTVNNNHLYVGSSAELLKILKEKEENNGN